MCSTITYRYMKSHQISSKSSNIHLKFRTCKKKNKTSGIFSSRFLESTPLSQHETTFSHGYADSHWNGGTSLLLVEKPVWFTPVLLVETCLKHPLLFFTFWLHMFPLRNYGGNCLFRVSLHLMPELLQYNVWLPWVPESIERFWLRQLCWRVCSTLCFLGLRHVQTLLKYPPLTKLSKLISYWKSKVFLSYTQSDSSRYFVPTYLINDSKGLLILGTRTMLMFICVSYQFPVLKLWIPEVCLWIALSKSCCLCSKRKALRQAKSCNLIHFGPRIQISIPSLIICCTS